MQKSIANDQERYRQLEANRIAGENKIKHYSLLSGLGVFVLIAFMLYTNNRQKQKANIMLESQKNEIQYTLSQLKSQPGPYDWISIDGSSSGPSTRTHKKTALQ